MPTIILSAQNFDIYDGDGLHPYARTGSTSVDQLVRAGAQGVILGHSEVGDAPEVVRKKLLTISRKQSERGADFLRYVTLLVGETWDEYEGRAVEEVAKLIAERLASILEGFSTNFAHGLVVGYEPHWGVKGSGRDDVPPPASELISASSRAIRETLAGLFSRETADLIPIIYGGRSTPERTEDILRDENVEGLILGSASSTIASTMSIAETMAKARPNKRKVLHANFKAYELTESYETYLEALRGLDESFTIYLSPPSTDLRVVQVLREK